jgi:hypothetical protein
MTKPARLLSFLALALTALSLAAAGRPLAPRTLAPTANYVFRPVSAFAGGRFLTIWIEDMGFLGRPIMGAFSDAAGARISQRAFPLDIPPVAGAFAYQLIATGDTFTLVWEEGDGLTRLADVDLEGQVTNRRTVALPDAADTRIAWNGTHFLAILSSSSRVASVTMFDRDGRIVLPAVRFPGETHGADVAVADGRFLVVTSGSAALMAQEVTAQGIGAARRVDTPGNAAQADHYPSRVLATAAGNGDVLVVWRASGVNSGQLRSALVRADGTVAPLNVLVTNGASPLEVVRSGDGYLVAFNRDGALHRLRLDAAGAAIGEPELVQGSFQGGLSAAAGAGTILMPFNTAPNTLSDIATTALTATGEPRTEIVSINPSRQLQPILGGGAVWTEIIGDTAVVRAAAVDDEGQAGPAVQVGTGFLAATETALNPDHYLVIYRDETRLLATRVTHDTTVADATPIVLADITATGTASAAVVSMELRPSSFTQWLVVWSDGRALYSRTVTRDGVASATQTLDVHPPIENGFLRLVGAPELAFDGSEVLLVWPETQMPPDYTPMDPIPPAKLWATRLTRGGAPADAQPLELGLAGPSLSVASSGFDFMVTAGQHAWVLKGDGPLRITASGELFGWHAVSDVMFDGSDYSVAIRYHGAPAKWYLAVLRVNSNAMAFGGRATATLTPDVEAAPSIVPGRLGALIGVQEGTIADGLSATVYTIGDLPFMPAPPAPPRNVQVQHVTSTSFEVNWDAPAGGDPDSYIVEQLIFGTWTIVARVTGDVHRANVNSHAGVPTVRVRAFDIGGPSEPAEQGSGQRRRRSAR